jgi:DNA-binding winged helix-turn-helix (wHTH) protein
MGWIKAGQSGCIVALRGGGKSNILRFLLREETRRHYLGQDYERFNLFFIDPLALTECTEWAVCDLILDRMLSQLRPPKGDVGIIEEMTPPQRRVMRSKDLLTAYRTLERCVDAFCREPEQKVVLLFSEFDALFQDLDPSLFRCLRAIRDAHKEQVSYVVVVAQELACLRDGLAEADPFYRLVSRNVCTLGPFNEADARYMIQYLAAQRSVDMSEADVTRLIELSGGHAGTIKAAVSLFLDTHRGGSLEELAPTLKDDPAIQAECRKVWASLSEREQIALCALATERQADPDLLDRLEQRGVIRDARSKDSIFSPLFAHFVHRQAPPIVGDTFVSRDPPVVQIGGQRIENLTELEFETLCYLYENRGRVCTKDELIENVYRQQYDRQMGGIDDTRLQTLISRLRNKLDPDRRPRYIVTVRGEGYKFVEPGRG